MRSLALVALLALGGCAEAGARAITAATGLADAAQAYVNENIEDRRWFRQQCRFIIQQEVARLSTNGKSQEALALLRGNYPSLLTARLARTILADVKAGRPVRTPPDICGPLPDETGPLPE